MLAVGFVSISVLGFLARSPPPLGLGLPTMYLYYFCIMATGNGIVWWFAYIPPDAHALSTTHHSNNLRTFREGVKAMGEWLPLIKWNCLALMINMYAVSFFTAIPFYVYNDSHCDKAAVDAGSHTCSMISVRYRPLSSTRVEPRELVKGHGKALALTHIKPPLN